MIVVAHFWDYMVPIMYTEVLVRHNAVGNWLINPKQKENDDD